MKITDYLKLNVPELTDSPPDITKLSDNFPKIDANAKSIAEQINSLGAYAVASGTNAYIVTIAGITALTEGFSIKIKFTNANTGAVTLNINSLGSKAIKKGNGNALSSGNIKAGQICNLVYNGSNFQLLGEGGEYGTATASDVLSGKTVGTDSGLIEGTMPNCGAVNQNLTTEGKEYTIPLGYHNGLGKIKAVITGLVASVIKAGTTVGGIAGNFTLDATATAAQMLSGAIAYVNGNKITGTIPSKGAQTYSPSTANQTIAVGQYLSGAQTISAVTGTAITSYVLNGYTFSSAFGINQTGNMANSGAVTGTIATQGGSYTVPVGYHNGSGKVTASFANLVAANVKNGVNIGGVIGTLLSVSGVSNIAVGETPSIRSSRTYITTGFKPDFVVLYYRSTSGTVTRVMATATSYEWMAFEYRMGERSKHSTTSDFRIDSDGFSCIRDTDSYLNYRFQYVAVSF